MYGRLQDHGWPWPRAAVVLKVLFSNSTPLGVESECDEYFHVSMRNDTAWFVQLYAIVV